MAAQLWHSIDAQTALREHAVDPRSDILVLEAGDRIPADA
jgi:hypothetical protein